MKYVRIIVILLFIVSAAAYGLGVVKERREEDPTMPSITSDRETVEVSVRYEEADLLAGLTAYDEKDGDLTSEILVGEFSQFIEDGICNITYVVFDSSNQAARLSRRVQFTDYESPKFTLSEPLVFPVGNSQSASDRVGATDLLDGNISTLVKQTASTIDYRTAGAYTISVEVTNSFGDVEEETLPVHIVEPSRQALEIGLSDTIVYVKKGEQFQPRQYIESLEDNYGGALDTELIEVSSNVDMEKEGCYEVHYQAENENGQIGETWMTVIVRA